MERVGILINKLQEQLLQKADIENMLVTAQLLHSELLLQVKNTTGNENKKVSVMVPNAVVVSRTTDVKETENDLYKPVPKPEPEPAPVAEPMPEPEVPMPEPAPVPTPRPEPEPIPHLVEQKPWQTIFSKKEEKASPWSLDPVSDVPTLAQHEKHEKVVYELNDVMLDESKVASINDKLKQQSKNEMGSFLQEPPIRDLKKAISINDRHRFIHELFRDDETMYERSIKTINGFNIFAEAEYWIQRELKVKLGWDTNLDLVKTFDQLVKRRFS